MKKTNPLYKLPRTERAKLTNALRSLAVVRVLTNDDIAKVVGGGGTGYDDDPHASFAGH